VSIKAAAQQLRFVSPTNWLLTLLLMVDPSALAENTVYVDQIGDNNAISITQETHSSTASVQLYNHGNSVSVTQGGVLDSGGHAAHIYINGLDNILNATQLNMGDVDSGHILNATILGNANQISSLQKDAKTKIQTLNINGNTNMISAIQQDAGNHSLSITLNGSGNSVTSSQTGSGSHTAIIDLTNGGGASSLDLSQSGATNKSYSLTQTCFNPAGCSASVTQH
jgi:hypothetical protein